MTTRTRVLLTACLAVAPMLVHSTQRGQPPSLAWQAVSDGPMGGTVTRLLESTSGVLLARVNDALYRSTDDGRSWRRCRDVPVRPARQSPYERPEWLWDTIGDNERTEPPLEFRPGALNLTDAKCETFGTVQVPGWTGNRFDDLAFIGISGHLVAVTSTGTLRSRDRGVTWQQTFSFRDGSPMCASARYPELLIVAGSRLYESKDEGATWTVVPEDPDAARRGVVLPGRSPKLGCPFIRAHNYHSLYAVGPDGVWWSNPGDTPEWTRIHSGRPEVIAATERRVWMLMQTPQGKVLMRSEDEGASWTTIPFALAKTNQLHQLLDTERGTLVAGTSAGIFRSTDKGESWTLTGVHPQEPTLAAGPRQTYASDSSGLWMTRDAGVSWQKVPATVEERPWTSADWLSRVFDVNGRIAAVVNDRLVRVTGDGTVFTPAGLDRDVHSLVHVKDTYYAAADNGVFRSRDFAVWTECSLGLNGAGPLLVIGRGDLLTGAAARSTDGCKSWWPFETDSNRRSPVSRFMFGRAREVIGLGEGIARLDLASRAWTDIQDATELEVTSVAVDGRGRYWIGSAHGVYALMPDNHGWEVFPMGLQHEQIVGLAVDARAYLIAAVRGRGLYRAALP